MRLAASALALSCALAATARAEPVALRVGTRVPIALVVGTPTGETAQVRSSDMIRAVSDHLRAHTDLGIELLESSLIAECRGRLLCLVERTGPGRAESKAAPVFLLVLANVSREGEPDRLSAQLVDLARATDTIERLRGTREDWAPEAEATLNEEAVTTERVDIAGPEHADRVIGEWIERRFADAIDREGHWEPYGEIVVEGVPAGLELAVDGQSVGATGEGETRVLEVRAGDRQLSLTGPDVDRYEGTVHVVRGEVVRLSPDLSRAGVGGQIRTAMLVGGGVLGAAGVALTVVGLVSADGSVTTYCFAGTGCSSGAAFVTSGYSADAAASLGSVDSGGVYWAPLGLGLVGAGASWAAGALLEDEGEVPWISLTTGAAVGILTYVLGASLSARPGVAP